MVDRKQIEGRGDARHRPDGGAGDLRTCRSAVARATWVGLNAAAVSLALSWFARVPVFDTCGGVRLLDGIHSVLAWIALVCVLFGWTAFAGERDRRSGMAAITLSFCYCVVALGAVAATERTKAPRVPGQDIAWCDLAPWEEGYGRGRGEMPRF